LSDEIEYYVKKYKLIDPFDPKNLKPAAYELTVGDEYAIGGKIKQLFDEVGKNEIRIPPFEVVVIKTKEIINLPRFLIARWNIRVKWAYEGLLWVGGPQVDPGWIGNLCCPIYNLSDKEVTLRLGDAIAIIDFVKTTPFNKDSKKYPRPPKRILFEDYNPDRLKSALYVEASRRIEQVEKDLNKFGSKLDTSIGINITVFSIIIAALTIMISLNTASCQAIQSWSILSFIFSFSAFIISFVVYFKVTSKSKGDSNEKNN